MRATSSAPGGREPAGAAVALEQLDAGLALERGELLGHRGRRVPERVRGGRDRAAGGELAQDAEAADVEHAKAQLTVLPTNRNWKLCRGAGILRVVMRPVHVSLAVAVAAIWGLNFVVIEVGLDDFPPLLLSSLRYALAALPLLVLRGTPPGVPWRWVFAVGVAIGVVKFSLLFIGMDVGMPAGLASLVLQVQALFTVVFAAAVLRERLVGAQIAGLAIAIGGLAVVASGLGGEATPTGFALVIAAAAAWGVGNLAIKRAAPPDPLRFMTWMCVVPPLPLLALSLAFEGPSEVGDALAGVDLGGIGAVLYIAFAATTVGWGAVGAADGSLPGRRRSPRSRCSCRSSASGSRRAARRADRDARDRRRRARVERGLPHIAGAAAGRPRAISPQLAGSS